MHDGKKNRFLKVIALFILSFTILMLYTGCEELLDEALTKDIAVEETLIESQTAETTDETVPITASQTLSKAAGAVNKSSGSEMIPILPADPSLFAWVLSEGGGSIQGTVTNNLATLAIFKVALGHTDVIASATIVGTVNLSGSASSDFVFEGVDLENFFKMHFDSYMTTVYVFLIADGSPPLSLTITNLNFQLQPSYDSSLTVDSNAEYADFADQIEEITNIDVSGTIKNLALTTMTVLIRLTPDDSEADWDGMTIAVTIAASDIFNLANWFSLLGAAELAELNSAIQYLSTGAILAELFLTTPTDLLVEITSVVLNADVTVNL